MEIDAYAFIDPTGLVPVVNEVRLIHHSYPTRLLDAGRYRKDRPVALSALLKGIAGVRRQEETT